VIAGGGRIYGGDVSGATKPPEALSSSRIFRSINYPIPMAIKQILPGLYEIRLGPVNAFLIDDGELTLIDTGHPGRAEKIAEDLRTIGRQPSDITNILLTHCHPDHAGSLAAMKKLSGAAAWAHPIEAAMIETGDIKMTMTPSPGLMAKIMFRLFIAKASGRYDAATVENRIEDGEELPIAGGIRAIQIPGHCAGQLAFLWPRHGGVLFVADAAANMMGLGLSIGYDDLNEAKRTLAKMGALDFEAACFGHGKSITKGAAGRFRKKWGPPPNQSPGGD
jgi:glyoxylase-like metal-dependent hydrolase (beta-lactamase superfamily II)